MIWFFDSFYCLLLTHIFLINLILLIAFIKRSRTRKCNILSFGFLWINFNRIKFFIRIFWCLFWNLNDFIKLRGIFFLTIVIWNYCSMSWMILFFLFNFEKLKMFYLIFYIFRTFQIYLFWFFVLNLYRRLFFILIFKILWKNYCILEIFLLAFQRGVLVDLLLILNISILFNCICFLNF